MNSGIQIKTYVQCDDGQTYLIDTIEYEGDLWLVPKWLDTPYPSMHKPARIIRMEKAALQALGDIFYNGLDVRKLDGQVPRAVLDGGVSSLSAPLLDVEEAPDLAIRR